MARDAVASRNEQPTPPVQCPALRRRRFVSTATEPSRVSPGITPPSAPPRSICCYSTFTVCGLLFVFCLFDLFHLTQSASQSVVQSPSAVRSTSLAALALPWLSRFPHRSVVDDDRVPPRRVASLRFLFHVAIILLPPSRTTSLTT